MRKTVSFKKGSGFPPPRFDNKAYIFARAIGHLYLRFVMGVDHIDFMGEKQLQREYQAFRSGESRLILAFRHTAKEDAPLLLVALNKKRWRHAQFLYGRDVLNWAGAITAWLFPRLGCLAVQNRGNNKLGMDLLKQEVKTGRFPLALAPEGQVTYHKGVCSEIAGGVANLAAWALETDKEVIILPIAIGYQYGKNERQTLEQLFRLWEEKSGFALDGEDKLNQAFEQMVSLVEQFYNTETEHSLGQADQIKKLCELALGEGERLANIPTHGSILDRLFNLRYAGEDALFPIDYENRMKTNFTQTKSEFEAIKAKVYLRHSQIVDVLQYVDPNYIQGPCPAGRACEFMLNLLDVLNRLGGGNIDSRHSPRHKKATLYIGARLDVRKSIDGIGGRKQKLEMIKALVAKNLQEASKALEDQTEGTYLP